MTRLVIPMNATPAVLRESLRCALRPHGIELPEHVLVEASNNMTQALFSIDENSEADEDNARSADPANVTCSIDDIEDELDNRDSDAPRIP